MNRKSWIRSILDEFGNILPVSDSISIDQRRFCWHNGQTCSIILVFFNFRRQKYSPGTGFGASSATGTVAALTITGSTSGFVTTRALGSVDSNISFLISTGEHNKANSSVRFICAARSTGVTTVEGGGGGVAVSPEATLLLGSDEADLIGWFWIGRADKAEVDGIIGFTGTEIRSGGAFSSFVFFLKDGNFCSGTLGRTGGKTGATWGVGFLGGSLAAGAGLVTGGGGTVLAFLIGGGLAVTTIGWVLLLVFLVGVGRTTSLVAGARGRGWDISGLESLLVLATGLCGGLSEVGGWMLTLTVSLLVSRGRFRWWEAGI